MWKRLKDALELQKGDSREQDKRRLAEKRSTVTPLAPQRKPDPPLKGSLRPTLWDLDMQVPGYQKTT